MFGMTGPLEVAGWAWVMLKTWASRRRTLEYYSKLKAADQWRKVLRGQAYRTWRSCFGPWIGSDWTRVSLHTAGQFFRHQLVNRPTHHHEADGEGPAWSHGAGDGWLLLRGPSSEMWFEKWVNYLSENGVTFAWEEPLESLNFDGTRITGACLGSGREVDADRYILAIDPFTTADIVAKNRQLAQERELRLFKPLTQDGRHVQVSFRLAFSEPILFPRERTAVVVADSEFNLTLFAQEQVWLPDVELGSGIQSLWTGTSCAATVPGRLYQKPVLYCTKEEFVEEVKAQIYGCGSLDQLVRQANQGRSLRSFQLAKIEVWHEWKFHPDGLKGEDPKWVNSTTTQAFQPNQRTTVPNLLLAGAHTRTSADVWSIEAAVESGRRAARAVDGRVRVLVQFKPRWLRVLSMLDDLCYALRLPHILDLLILGLLLYGIWSTLS